ncbi:MAG: hypothetical protein NkDv07_0514 [Candidatus Improbicoccus devescovinae]|nr:MAG: hypothetical protein NkDv07_0514 [Candidatus Improbicoccus devescovinae]
MFMKILKKTLVYFMVVSFVLFNFFGVVLSAGTTVSRQTSVAEPGSGMAVYLSNIFKKTDEGGIAIGGSDPDAETTRQTKATKATKDSSTAISTSKVFFGGNEYWVVSNEEETGESTNTTNNYLYLLAARPYVSFPFYPDPVESSRQVRTEEQIKPRNSYNYGNKLSSICKYFTDKASTVGPDSENGDVTRPSTEAVPPGYNAADWSGSKLIGDALKSFTGQDLKNFYLDFFKNNRDRDWNLAIDTAVKTNMYPASNDTDLNFTTPSTTTYEGKFWLPSVLKGTNDSYSLSIDPNNDGDFKPDLRANISTENTNLSIPRAYWSSTAGRTRTQSSDRASNHALYNKSAQNPNSIGDVKVGMLQDVFPACRINLADVVYADSLDSDSKVNTENFSIKTPSDGLAELTEDSAENVNKNVVLTVKSEDVTSKTNAIESSLDETGALIITPVTSTLKTNEYLGLIIDSGSKIAFINGNLYKSSDSTKYTIPSEILDKFGENIKIQIHACEDNTNSMYASETGSETRKRDAETYEVDDYKIRYARHLADIELAEDTSIGESSDYAESEESNIDEYTFNKTDPASGVIVKSKGFPSDSLLNVTTATKADQLSEYFEFVKNNIDNPEHVENYTIYSIAVQIKKATTGDSDSIEYENVGNFESTYGEAEVWLPVPEGYTKSNLQARFISTEEDTVKPGTIEKIGDKEYYVFKTTHFSPYGLLDLKDSYYYPQTGQKLIGTYLITATSTLMATLVILTKNRTKKRVF